MTDSTDSIREKIRKLLKVAECDSASEAERAAAIYQASRLSQKYAIDLDSLGAEASDFGETVLQSFPTRSASWCVAVSSVLCSHFNVRSFTRSRFNEDLSRVVEWRVFGCRPSREVAVYVWVFLSREFQRLAREMRPKSRPSFYISMAAGLIAKLNAMKDREQQPQCFDLMIKSVSEELTTYKKLDAEFGRFSSGFGMMRQPKIDADREAYLRGKEIEIAPALRTTELKKIRVQ